MRVDEVIAEITQKCRNQLLLEDIEQYGREIYKKI